MLNEKKNLLLQFVSGLGKNRLFDWTMYVNLRGWSGGAMVLGKRPVLGRPTIWLTVGQGPTALAVGTGGGCLDIFTLIYPFSSLSPSGWSGGAMVLGKLPVPGRPTVLITVGQGPIALAVGAGGGGLDIFTLIYPSFPLSPSLWETTRYRLKYCLKGPLNPKPTNQLSPSLWETVRYRLKYCLKGPLNQNNLPTM